MTYVSNISSHIYKVILSVSIAFGLQKDTRYLCGRNILQPQASSDRMFAKSQINIDLVTTEAFCLNTSPETKKDGKITALRFPSCCFSAHKDFMMK